MSEPTPEFCAAYGCPLLGVYGAGGKWYCCCHRNADASRNDAITLELNCHRELTDRAVSLRRLRAGYQAIKQAEDALVELTREVGAQHAVPTAGVIGPETAVPHYADGDDR